MNEHTVGDIYFAPGWTSYKKMLEYQKYDITDLILDGENTIKISVGKGWYASPLGFAAPHYYGQQTAVLAVLHILYEDGSREIIATDESWRSETSFIVDSEIYAGEKQSFIEDKTEGGTVIVAYDKNNIIAQVNEPCRVCKTIEPIAVFTTPRGEQIVDFGQILTGIVQLKVNADRGTKVIIKHAEILDENGNFYTANLRKAKCEDEFVLAGGRQTLSPLFTFHGFRYVQVQGVDIEKSNIRALFIHSDIRPAGTLVTSNKDVNKLLENIKRSQLDNYVDVPTDCPQRDERMGWTGDANVFMNTASYQFDVYSFFKKWLKDFNNDLATDKNMPSVIPDVLGGSMNTAVWGDSVIFLPWKLYQMYGDKNFLVDQWETMNAYTQNTIKSASSDGLIKNGFQYGDWLGLDKQEGLDSHAPGSTDVYFVTNVFYCEQLRIMSMVALILNKPHEADYYNDLYKKTLSKIRAEYFTATGRMITETQTSCALALYFDIVPQKYKKKIISTFESCMTVRGHKLCTGFVGTPYLCFALTDNGLSAESENVIMTDEYPGWLYAVGKGATTVWERWNGIQEDGTLYNPSMNSFNHYANGAIAEYFYRRIAGIENILPGFKRIRIKPTLTAGLKEVSAVYDSVYGTIKSSYKVENKVVTYEIEIPANTTAEIWLEGDKKPHEVGSGKYTFTRKTDKNMTRRFVTLDTRICDFFDKPALNEAMLSVYPEFFDSPLFNAVKSQSVRVIEKVFGKVRADEMQKVIDKVNDYLDK